MSEQILSNQLVIALEMDNEEEFYSGICENNIYHTVKSTNLTIFEYLMKQSIYLIKKYYLFLLDLGYNPKFINNKTLKMMLRKYEAIIEFRPIFRRLLTFGLILNTEHIQYCIHYELQHTFSDFLKIVPMDEEIVRAASESSNSYFLEGILEGILESFRFDYDIPILYNFINNIRLTIKYEDLLGSLQKIYLYKGVQHIDRDLYKGLLMNIVYDCVDNENVIENFNTIFNFISSISNDPITSEHVMISLVKFHPAIFRTVLEQCKNINKNQSKIYEYIISHYNLKTCRIVLDILIDNGFNINVMNQNDVTITQMFKNQFEVSLTLC